MAEFNSFNALWKECKKRGISGCSGSTATSCLRHAADLAIDLSAAMGETVTINGNMAQTSQHPNMLAAPTLA